MHFSNDQLTKKQKQFRRRILEISFAQKLSHLGSCFSSIDLIATVYEVKKNGDEFVLSNGHAGIAWYVVLEDQGLLSAKQLSQLYIHPDRNPRRGITVSTGSLGQGLPIALGMAMANKKQAVFCLVSDGEMSEGSIWEALRIGYENNVTNLKIIVNANGWAAYKAVSLRQLKKQIKAFGFDVNEVNGHNTQELKAHFKEWCKQKNLSVTFARTTVEQLPFLKGQDAHYYLMNEKEYQLALKDLK